MNREQKAAVIDKLADQIGDAQAIFAVDYRGISVPQVADLRSKLRESESTFQVVKNSLTERAVDKAGVEGLKEILEGPTAFTFVSGDIAAAAKTLTDFATDTELLAFKGGLMDGKTLAEQEFKTIAKLPNREVLYGQLAGMVASPITGLARGLNALLSGIAIALGRIRDQELLPATAQKTSEPEEKPENQNAAAEAEGEKEPSAQADADAKEQS